MKVEYEQEMWKTPTMIYVNILISQLFEVALYREAPVFQKGWIFGKLPKGEGCYNCRENSRHWNIHISSQCFSLKKGTTLNSIQKCWIFSFWWTTFTLLHWAAQLQLQLLQPESRFHCMQLVTECRSRWVEDNEHIGALILVTSY